MSRLRRPHPVAVLLVALGLLGVGGEKQPHPPRSLHAPTQTYSLDAAVVFEKDQDIYYSLYGHTAVTPAAGQDPRIPRPAQQAASWHWWSIGADESSDTTTIVRPVAGGDTASTESRPDIAFSRAGFALAAWVREPGAGITSCVDEFGNTNFYPQIRGVLGTARLMRQADGDVIWEAGALLEPPANTEGTSYVYHAPSLAVDSNGSALLIWAFTTITHHPDCNRTATQQILARRWDGTAWVDQNTVMAAEPTACGPLGYAYLPFHCPDMTDLAFTARVVTGHTRQQALAVWYDMVELGDTCLGPQPLLWPKAAVWDGSAWEAPVEIPGRPLFTLTGSYTKLGISADQRDHAWLLFPVTYDDDPCLLPGASEVRYARWDGDSQAWQTAAMLTNGANPDLALLSDNSAVGVYNGDDDLRWATATDDGVWTNQGDLVEAQGAPIASAALVHAAGGEAARTVVVFSADGALRWMERVGSGAWTAPAQLAMSASGSPELAAHTGSPSLPTAEWAFAMYEARAGEAAKAQRMAAQLESVGATSQVNVVSVSDGLSANVEYIYHMLETDGATNTDNRAVLRNLGASNTVDMGHPDTLRDFVAWAWEIYPADRVALEMEDHGMGWLGCMLDNNTHMDYRLTLPELSAGLDGALTNGGATESLDLLILRACNMATFETAYQVRHLAEYMLASEPHMDTPTSASPEGLRNDHLLQGQAAPHPNAGLGLVDDPQRTTLEAAKNLVSIFQNDYTNPPPAPPDHDSALTAMGLGQTNALFTAVSDLAVQLNAAVAGGNPDQAANLATLRAAFSHAQQMAGNAGGQKRDLRHFAQLVQAAFPNDADNLPNDPNDAAGAVANALAVGDANFVVAEWHDTTHPNAFGVSVWLERHDAGVAALENRGDGSGAADSRLTLYQATAFDQALPAAGKWSALVNTVSSSEGMGVRLQSADPLLYVTVATPSGESLGQPDPTKDCNGVCGGSLPGATCHRWQTSVRRLPTSELVQTEIFVPRETATALTWRVDGSLLEAAADYALTLQILAQDGSVVSETVVTGTLNPGETGGGSFGYPVVYLPVMQRD